ncbi:MAG: hypothetical protein K6E27_04760 [Eubacterium sp.]|nr:hypothetical protein [Eubacterium sp.]
MMTTIDSFESNSLSTDGINITEKNSQFNKSFDSGLKSVDGVFKNNSFEITKTNINDWIGIDSNSIRITTDSVVSNAKQMYSGTTMKLQTGDFKTEGISDIAKRGGDIKQKSMLKSKAGFDAEIISTAKENIVNEALDNGNKTYRADDRPDKFSKNDPYVDKFIENSDGIVTERIQVKFIGDDGKSCYKKIINTKKFDKYFTDGKVDKIEIPKDYYDSAKEALASDRTSLENQIERLRADGKTEIADQKQARLDKVNQLDGMLKQSNTTSTEAIQAVKHPKLYAAKQMMPSVAKKGAMDGVNQAKTAMMVTGAISTVDNVSKYLDGDITADEAVKGIAVDTGTAGAAAFSVGFISSSTASLMSSSSNKLISSVGKAGNGCLPAAAVSYGIEVHGTVVEYAKGNIDNAEFVDDLGRSGAKVAGGMVGGTIGSVAGPVGSFAGASIGSEVGVAAYDTVQYVAETSVDLALGETTIEEVTEEVTDAAINKAEEIKDKAVETAENYKEIAEFVAEETGVDEKVSDIKETVDETIEVTKTNIAETSDKIKESAEEKVDEVKGTIEETAEKTVETVKDYQQSAKELVSSTVNYAVTSEAYVTASETLEAGSEELGKLETKAKEYADKAIDKAGDFGSDAVKDVKAAFNDFNLKNSLPFNI